MLQLYMDLASSRLACRDIQRIQLYSYTAIQLYSYTRYTAYSTIQRPSARRPHPEVAGSEATSEPTRPFCVS